MKNKTKTILLILLTSLGLLFVMSSNCSASTVPDFSEYVLENDGYIVYYNTNSNIYKLLVFRNLSSTLPAFDFSDVTLGSSVYYGDGVGFSGTGKEITSQEGTRLMFYTKPSSTGFYRYDLVDGIWTLAYEKTGDSWRFSQTVSPDFLNNIVSINFDLYSVGNNALYDGGSSLVFQKPPVGEIPVVVERTLAPIMEKTPLEEVMKEILGILPVILMTIVGLISLRKALQLLSRALHRS